MIDASVSVNRNGDQRSSNGHGWWIKSNYIVPYPNFSITLAASTPS